MTIIKVYTRFGDTTRNRTGGDYDHWYMLEWNKNANLYRKTYHTSAEFEYCDIYGSFQQCKSCRYFRDNYCHGEVEMLSKEEVNTLKKELVSLIGGKENDYRERGCKL